jgi:hypothetical protein
MATLQTIYSKHCVGNAPKKNKKNLYKFLDGFNFVDQWEIQDAVLEFCEIHSPSYAELIFAEEMADEYITKRKIENIYFLPF